MIRTAVFGLGNVAERIHLPACRDVAEIELVGASEPREERREEIARRFALPAVYADSRELVEREKPELVLVGTPPDSHRELVLLALEAGADVVCEKPFMLTSDEAAEVLEAARRHGRLLAVNTQYRYMQIYQAVRRGIEEGRFGRPYFLQCWQQMYHPPAFEKLAWRARLERSTLYEFAPHALDLVCSFFDALPETVSAHTPRVHDEFPSDVLVQMTLRFPGDRLATIAFNRVSHAPERYLEMRLDCAESSVRISLGGVARAGVEAVRFRGGRAIQPFFSLVKGGEAREERRGRSRVIAREPDRAFASATARHLREVVAWRHGDGRERLASAERARAVMRIVEAGYRAAETGRTVALEDPAGDG